MNGKKISILGSGRVGSSIAYSLTLAGTCSEIVLVDIAKDLATGEAMDIYQGTAFSQPVNIYSGEYEDVAGSDIIVLSLGMARKPGQTRIELAQANVDILKSVIPSVAKIAPDAIYIIVSNPVDILTHVTLKITDLKPHQVIGSGTLLDTSRLRSIIAEKIGLNPSSINGYVLGEHGDSSVVPWSLINVAGMSLEEYESSILGETDASIKEILPKIETEMRTSGAEVIKRKGVTNFAIAMSVNNLCSNILRDTNSILSVSTLMTGEYGMEDVCLSIPCIVASTGIVKTLQPKLTDVEKEQLQASANMLKGIIETLKI